eukprot:7549462-Pyramimonas_sp.AAC.1
MWLSPQRRAYSFKHLQGLHGLTAGRFQNVALALAPRPFFVNITRVSRIESGSFKMWLSP